MKHFFIGLIVGLAVGAVIQIVISSNQERGQSSNGEKKKSTKNNNLAQWAADKYVNFKVNQQIKKQEEIKNDETKN